MNIILFDDSSWENLLPLTFTRPVAELRVGIFTIKEKWDRYFRTSSSYLTQQYLQEKYFSNISEDNLLINGSVVPEGKLVEEIKKLSLNQALVYNDIIIATRLSAREAKKFNFADFSKYKIVYGKEQPVKINFPWEIFVFNDQALRADFEIVTENRFSVALSDTNTAIGNGTIFIEEGATVEGATLNTSEGPIYIGENAEIMEGVLIRGPFALCNNAVVKMGAKIYGATTIGPYSKVGGEINNSVIFGYSNKAHDGFLGNSVLGEWCNIGADSNNSNLKNNYTEVRIWNYREERFIPTGLVFCGLIMGDHSKCGINTMFNTGTVVGVSSNIFGSGFPRNYIPSFSWGGPHGFTIFNIDKAFEVAEIVMKRRDLQFNDLDRKILTNVFGLTKKYREH